MTLTTTLSAFLLATVWLPADDPGKNRYRNEGYQLVWAQEFNEDGKPDDDVWGYEHGFARNREAQWYQRGNASIKDGCLVIEGRRERVENPHFDPDAKQWQRKRKYAEYTSSSLTTRGKHEWLYGRFEMRAKIDIRDGLWPAWWTLGSPKSGRHWPACGEVDVMEYYRGMVLANACWSKGGRQQHWDAVRVRVNDLAGKNVKQWADEFHVWRMDWDKDSIVIYLDGRLLNTIAVTKTKNPDGSNPFRAPHYMIVNLAIGGTQGGDPSKTKFPARYLIDYIRVYQKQELSE